VTSTPSGLIDDLRRIGVPDGDLWELVNAKVQYRAAVPVLIDWLRKADARVPDADRPKVREGLVRALSVPTARPATAPVLIVSEFRKAHGPDGRGLGWVVGNALSVVADDSVFDEIAALVGDHSYGSVLP
jgi:hypothetical protein